MNRNDHSETESKRMPRVLVVHNCYRQTGGEDSVFSNEVALLRNAGCHVDTLRVSNDTIRGTINQITTALGTTYNLSGRRIVADALTRFRPEVVHVHNFFPRLSPALFDACEAAGVPAVWTLHNFRVTCGNGLLFRDGQPCEDCVGNLPLPAVLHRCYRDSTAGSAAVAAMIVAHRWRGTWDHKVARFIALNDFARDIFIRAGLPASRVVVKGNSIADPSLHCAVSRRPRAGALYVGRLSVEKGTASMLEAWRSLPDIPLTVIGAGPEGDALKQRASNNVSFLGLLEHDAVLQAISEAQALILPSICYENFPMTVVEAMGLGTPVIAARIGAMEVIISDDHDGLHFTAGDVADMARVVRGAFTNPTLLTRLGEGARKTWCAKMAPEKNVERLIAIYREAIEG